MGSFFNAYPLHKNVATITPMMATSRAMSKSFCTIYDFVRRLYDSRHCQAKTDEFVTWFLG